LLGQILNGIIPAGDILINGYEHFSELEERVDYLVDTALDRMREGGTGYYATSIERWGIYAVGFFAEMTIDETDSSKVKITSTHPLSNPKN
jgi:hypothetical protein